MLRSVWRVRRQLAPQFLCPVCPKALACWKRFRIRPDSSPTIRLPASQPQSAVVSWPFCGSPLDAYPIFAPCGHREKNAALHFHPRVHLIDIAANSSFFIRIPRGIDMQECFPYFVTGKIIESRRCHIRRKRREIDCRSAEFMLSFIQTR